MHLANSTSSLNLPAVESENSAGAPEIEIRELAIAAGIAALNQFDPSDWAEAWVSSQEIVAALFDAMLPLLQKSTAASTSRPLSLRESRASVPAEEHTSELQSRENLVCRLL